MIHLHGAFSLHSINLYLSTNPSCLPMISNRCKFSLRELNFQTPVWPSVLLKYALPPFLLGSMYQLPHLSFATSGLLYAFATDWANSASSRIDRSRLWMDKVLRLISPRVFEKLWFACSLKTISATVKGIWDMSYLAVCWETQLRFQSGKGGISNCLCISKLKNYGGGFH